MSEQSPHVEVFSRNRISRSTIILGVIPVTLFSGVLIYALWQFLLWIAIGMLALLSIGALYLTLVLAIDVRRRWLHAHVIHLGEYGALDAQQWRMLPLALPPPVITEEKSAPVIDRSQEEADILEMHTVHGIGFKSIAQAYKDGGNPYWTEYRVRQLCNREK